MRMILPALFLTLALSFAAQAACPAAEDVPRFAADWRNKKTTKGMPVETPEEAVCIREEFVKEIGKTEGRVVGYKAALTGKAAQQRFKTDSPISGVLFEKMILPSGAKLPVAVGGNPVYEADMLLVVKDDGINTARTPEDAIKHISGMRPFIEIPDLMLVKGEKLEAIQLIAMNAAGRFGVAGEELPLAPTTETVKALANVRIVMTSDDGKVLGNGSGADNLGNPLNVVLWLVQDLAASGRSLKAGDLVSIGSFSPLFPPETGRTITVSYEGLPATPTVSVSFD